MEVGAINSNFLDELRNVAKTPDQIAGEKEAERQNIYYGILTTEAETTFRKIKEALLTAAKEGKTENDVNGNRVVTCKIEIASNRYDTVRMPSYRSFSRMCSKNDPYAPLVSTLSVISETRGQGVFRSSFDRKFDLFFKAEPIVQQVYELVKSMAKREQISCSLCYRIRYSSKNGTRFKEFTNSQQRIKTGWNEDVYISIMINAQALF